MKLGASWRVVIPMWITPEIDTFDDDYLSPMEARLLTDPPRRGGPEPEPEPEIVTLADVKARAR